MNAPNNFLCSYPLPHCHSVIGSWWKQFFCILMPVEPFWTSNCLTLPFMLFYGSHHQPNVTVEKLPIRQCSTPCCTVQEDRSFMMIDYRTLSFPSSVSPAPIVWTGRCHTLALQTAPTSGWLCGWKMRGVRFVFNPRENLASGTGRFDLLTTANKLMQ